MKLLIITQKVDRADPVLGFFHRWIEELAKNYEKIIVICLQKGKHDLPSNVKVLSLGKEDYLYHSRYIRRFVSLWRFYKYIWQERSNYDAVFVHMNQEYILLGGKFWLLWGKKVFLWRNHHAGNFLTDIAALFCHKIFCTSKFSYTAKYKKTVLMPVGVDTDLFKPNPDIKKIPDSILSLGRIAPAKNIHILVESLDLLKKKGVNFTANIYGDALPHDTAYFEKLKSRARELNLDHILTFRSSLPNYQTPEIYNQHEVFINLSSSGMYDKTIFEAMACGCLTLASNENLRGQVDERLIIGRRKAEEVAEKLSFALSLPAEEKKKIILGERELAEKHSLAVLAGRLMTELSELSVARVKITRFLIAGSTAAGTNLIIFYLATRWLGIWYILSSIIAFALAFCVSFVLQKFWTFQDHSTAKVQRQVITYLGVALAGLLLNVFLMYIMVQLLGLNDLLSQILSNGLIAVSNFFVYKHLIFRHV